VKKEFLLFPRSAKLYLMSQFLLSGYYTWPFWYGFASERISPYQFGMYLAITYIIGLIAEVPTGAFADRYGRKRSALLGAMLSAIIPVVVFFGSNFNAYVVAAVFAGLGGAFVSGSLESLVHDLPTMTKELYRKIMVQDTFFFQAGLIFSSVVGGFMYNLHRGLPFMAQLTSFLLAAFVILKMSSEGEVAIVTEGAGKGTKKTRIMNYIRATKEGFLHLFTVKTIRPLIIFGCTVSVLMWMSIEYINEAAMIHYKIQPDSRGLLIAGMKLVALIVLHSLVIKKVKTDKQKLLYLLFVTVFVFALYSLGIKSFFLIAFLGFNLVSSTNTNFIRPMLHDHIQNKWRATAISAYSFISNLVQAIVSVGVGYMLQTQGVVFVQRFLLVLLLVVGLPALLMYLPRIHTNEPQN
jgi:MFS family permease